MKTTERLREGLRKGAAHAAGQIRRVAITITSKALWQLSGFRQLDGSTETFSGEPFLGIGFHARPAASGKPEAIVLMPGDTASSPVVVAVRDEATRQAIANALAADETAIFNSKVIAIAKADGTFEVRSKTGIAVELATKADLAALKAAIAGAAVVSNDGGAALRTNILAALGGAWPAGTSKLKGE